LPYSLKSIRESKLATQGSEAPSTREAHHLDHGQINKMCVRHFRASLTIPGLSVMGGTNAQLQIGQQVSLSGHFGPPIVPDPSQRCETHLTEVRSINEKQLWP